MTTLGGKDYDTLDNGGQGVIFKTDKYGKHYQVAYDFDSATGIEPHGSLVQGNNGKLYGITGSLSSTMFTCLFEFDPITRIYKVLMKADTLTGGGSYRRGTPLHASNNKIYSLCYNKLIETDPVTGINLVISNALITAGGENYFMQASNGKIYFVTQGSNGLVGQRGGLFEFDPQSKIVTLRYQFIDQTGSAAYGSLVEWTPGILYGLFTYGSNSINEPGGIFTYNYNTGTYTQKQLLYNLGLRTVSSAKGKLTRWGNKLYGMTEVGGQQDVGFLYSYDPATNTLDSLIDFSTINYTTFPFDSLRDDSYAHSNGWEFMLASDNKLYGLTIGSMFSYDPATKEFKSLNKLSVGGGITGHPEINKLGIYTFYAHLLEICTPPYYRNTISDTLYFIVGQPATFTISTPNTDTFHWTKNNTAIALADSTLSFTSIALADSGTYQCLLKNECGDSLLKSFYVKVGQILPIGFALTGKVQNNNVVLQWQDLAANNVNYYELQRSADGRNFAPLTKVLATNQTVYRYTDEGFETFAKTGNGRAFYRLKQTGKDGKDNLSNIVELNTEPSALNFALSPNPAKDKLTVTLAGYEGKATLTIVDVKGGVLLTKTVGNGNNTIHLPNWSAGKYVVVITDKTGRSESKKVVVVE